MKSLTLVSMVVIYMSVASQVSRAEPVVNLPDSEVEEQSQEAALALLESIRLLYSAIIELERREVEKANETASRAVDNAKNAEALYIEIRDVSIEEHAPAFRTISELENEVQEHAQAVLGRYAVSNPKNFPVLVKIVAEELGRYRGTLQENSEFSGNLADGRRIGAIQSSIDRVIQIGAIVPYFTKSSEE